MNQTAENRVTLPLPELRAQFLLDPEITFLNHGSFGACPRPVFEVYQQWQRDLESNPVGFIGRRLPDLLAEAKTSLAAYVGAQPENLVFVPNATYAINIVARSLKLQPGDEVLASDHEYGAVNNTWRFNCEHQGASYINQAVPVPIEDEAQIVDALWAGVTERTKVIVISHVTSPTALVFPVAEVCKRARAAGILTVIDGAHAPSQVDLNLEQIGADFYAGNLHKWVSAPKGSAFLYARPECQHMLEPLVVSHGWRYTQPGPSPFLDYFTWVGTSDPSAYLSVSAAIEFQQQHDWPAVRQACHDLARKAQTRLLALSGLSPISADELWVQLRAVPLAGSAADYKTLWEDYQIVVPVFEWQNHTLVRISIQAYNTPEDVDRLVQAVEKLMPRS